MRAGAIARIAQVVVPEVSHRVVQRGARRRMFSSPLGTIGKGDRLTLVQKRLWQIRQHEELTSPFEKGGMRIFEVTAAPSNSKNLPLPLFFKEAVELKYNK